MNADWSKAKRLGPLDMIREITTIAMLEAVRTGRCTTEDIEWMAQRMDELMTALIAGKGVVPNDDGTYAIIDRPADFNPDPTPEVLVIKPKSQELK